MNDQKIQTAREWLEEVRGLDLETLAAFDVRWGAGKRGEVVAMPYRRNGEIQNHKVRIVGARSELEGRPFYWSRTGVPHGLFNEDILRDRTLEAEPIIITEGEFDALSVIQSGMVRVVSLSDGWSGDGHQDNSKAKPLFDLQDLFRKSPKIIIAGDNDETGEAFVRSAFNIFEGHPVHYVTWPDGCKDANDTLAKHGSSAVVKAINASRPVNPPGGRISSFSDRLPDPQGQVYQTGDGVVDDVLAFHQGFLTVVSGIPAMGKSTFLTWALHQTGRNHRIRVATAFKETPSVFLEDHLCRIRTGRPFADLTDARRDEFREGIDRDWCLLEGEPDASQDMDWIIQMMRSAAVQHGCRIIALDPWNEFDHNLHRGETMTDYTKEALKVIRQRAERYGCAVAIVAHPTKMQDHAGAKPRPPLGYDISGSSTWFDKAAIGLTVHKDEDDYGEHVKLINWKSKFRQLYKCREGVCRVEFDQSKMVYRRRMG